jgi:hypothetical protein
VSLISHASQLRDQKETRAVIKKLIQVHEVQEVRDMYYTLYRRPVFVKNVCKT